MLMLTCIKGLNSVAAAEIKEKLKDFVILRQEPGFIFLDYNGHPRRLLDLRSIEDIFYVLIDETGFTRSRSTLSTLEEKIKYASFEKGLDYHAQLYSKPKHTTFQIFTHLYGRFNFRRIDLDKVVSRTIALKFNKWKATHGEAKIEFDVRLFKSGELILSLRLSNKFFSNRKYKVIELLGALKPTVAYALVCLTQPRPDDIFADPFCGSGTILMERSLTAPARKIFGYDRDANAVETAQANCAARPNIELAVAAAQRLPLPDRSLDVMATNPPFGATFAQDQNLFSDFLAEAGRVLKPGGRLVVLNGDVGGFETAVKKSAPRFRVENQQDINLLGKPARIWVLKAEK